MNSYDYRPTISWLYPDRGSETTPPASTAILLVDVGNHLGAIRIHERTTGRYVDGVGTEQAGNVVLIPWKESWLYATSGRIRVGYVSG